MPITESLERGGEPFGPENGRITRHDRTLLCHPARGVGLIMAPGFDVSGLVFAMGDAVVVSDPEGLIVVWNPAAERIFGFSQAEALGQPLDLITPDRHRRRHWDGYHKTMRTGVTKYGADVLRVPALHRDGHSLSIAFTVGMLHGEDGAVTGIAAIIRDETVRWEEERRMRRRISDLESEIQTSVSA